MKIMALPRDANPYQELLYEPMRRRGIPVVYLMRLTPSHTLNLVLLPLEIAGRRLMGWRVLHVHWLYCFGFPWAPRSKRLARVSDAILNVTLATSGLLGVRVAWTAHNVLPHESTFSDDAAARRTLIARSSVIFAHGDHARPELEALGATSGKITSIGLGRIGSHFPSRLGRNESASPRRFAFFGGVREYKGVEDLIVAFLALDDRHLDLVIAGSCTDPVLADRLRALAGGSPAIRLRLEYLEDDVLDAEIGEADFVVLPFRRVTTSSSAVYALECRKPLIVPDLPALRDLPSDAVIRYDGTTAGLRGALRAASRLSPDEVSSMRRAAARFVDGLPSWEQIATTTVRALSDAGRRR